MKLLLAVFILGCSNIDTPIYSSRSPHKAIIITKPPIQAVYIGPVTKEGMKFTKGILKELRRYPFNNYKFNPQYKLEVIYDGSHIERKENLWN
jgi:hypothetical protein